MNGFEIYKKQKTKQDKKNTLACAKLANLAFSILKYATL